ncbi:MAG: ABC transporter ATP-binding protein [Clostridia bacterium]|nr:ABC transporter ATP-binding protein [Clostridia bacterium]
MKDFVSRYDEGKRTNARKQAKYDREVKQAEKRAAKGKDYKVAMPTTIDLDLVKENMLAAIQSLKEHYIERNEAETRENKRLKTDTITDYLKENASGMVHKVTKQAARNKALKLMEEVGIPEPRKRYNQYPFEFSGGMRQRIVIAIALAANPDILICDEPTTALDVTIQAQILELIQNLKKKRDLSVIFITHDLGVVANMADRIAVMYAGKVVEYGTSEEVFYSPAHPYTWALLSSMPDLDSKDKLEAIPGTPPDMRYPPKGDAFAERNAYAMKIDFERQPPEFTISDTHWAATWLLHPDAPKVEPPKAVTNRIEKMKARMEAEGHV